jgi:hypothetical protein
MVSQKFLDHDSRIVIPGLKSGAAIPNPLKRVFFYQAGDSSPAGWTTSLTGNLFIIYLVLTFNKWMMWIIIVV